MVRRSTPTLGRIRVARTEILQFLGIGVVVVSAVAGVFLVSAVGLFAYNTFVLAVLRWAGTSAQGSVVRSVKKDNGEGSVFYVVSYEFVASDGRGKGVACEGKQNTSYCFRPKDVVAIRYWSKWPRISRIVERAVEVGDAA